MTADLLELRPEAIGAFSASVGPTDPQTTSAFGRLVHVALRRRRSRRPSPPAFRQPARGARARRCRAPAGAAPEPGRNDPRPCGSGRTFKRCCGG